MLPAAESRILFNFFHFSGQFVIFLRYEAKARNFEKSSSMIWNKFMFPFFFLSLFFFCEVGILSDDWNYLKISCWKCKIMFYLVENLRIAIRLIIYEKSDKKMKK